MMYEENQKDCQECARVTESSMRGETYYNDGKPGDGKVSNERHAFYKETLYRDNKTAGFLMQYPHGTVISQGEHSSFYRGENQIYASSKPSLYRSIENFDEKEDQQLYRLIADMRIAEFRNMIFRFGFVRFWNMTYSDVLHEALA